MANDTIVTVTGHVGQDPELRFTASGVAVCNLSVASTPRRYNSQTSEWDEGDTTWYRVNVWREYAENVAETINRGDRVIVTGRLNNREYENKDGEKRYSLEIDADEIGPSLRFATAKINRRSKRDEPPVREAPGASDPWGTPPAQAAPDKPPF